MDIEGTIKEPLEYFDKIKQYISTDLSTLPGEAIRQLMLWLPPYIIYLRTKANAAKAEFASAKAKYEYLYNISYLKQEKGSVEDKKKNAEVDDLVLEQGEKLREAEIKFNMIIGLPDSYDGLLQVLKRIFDDNAQEKRLSRHES